MDDASFNRITFAPVDAQRMRDFARNYRFDLIFLIIAIGDLLVLFLH
jgi:hypothetical protein